MRLSVGIENRIAMEEIMNRTVRALTDYPQLFEQIERELASGQTFVYLVADDGFAHDAQIWTESERDEILAGYAQQDPPANVDELREKFSSSREVFHVDASDLKAAREAVA